MARDVIYLDNLDDLDDVEGTKYIANGLTRSIVAKDVVLKDLSGFGGDLQLAQECLEIWRDLGLTGAPSSPASFFRKLFPERGAIKASHNNLFRPYFHGGWIEAFTKGSVLDTVYLYDIIKAYLWAGSLGFPSRVRPYCKGDENFIGIVKIHKKRPEAPVYFRREYTIATFDDIQEYDLDCSIVDGVTWDQLDIRPAEFIYSMQNILPPKAWKLLTQGYWGIWAQTMPLAIEKKTGETSHLNNYYQNLVFASLIVNRVIYRLWEKSKGDSIAVYVDSVLTTDKIEEGNNIGDFKLKHTFEDGIFLKNAGVWTPIDKHSDNLSNWFKHAGYN